MKRILSKLLTPSICFGEINPSLASNFAAKDTNRIQGNVIRILAKKTPFTDVLEGGTMASGVSDTQRVVVQEVAVTNQSLTRPASTPYLNSCGNVGPTAEMGSTEFDYAPAIIGGRGPLICVFTTWAAFKDTYKSAEDSLRKGVVQIMNADVRANLVDASGCKMVLQINKTFDQLFDGNVNSINTPFPGIGVPNAGPSFASLEYLGRFMREDLMVEPFPIAGDDDGVLKVIASQQTIQILRNGADVRTDYRYITAGSFKVGKDQLTKYSWEGPYRGFAFGVDPQPLRFDTLDGYGQPIYIEPYVNTEVTNGNGNRPNPLWVRAKYEVMLVMGKGGFRRLIPESSTGEGTMKFPPQVYMGQLKWKNTEDNDQNAWGDWGYHLYRMNRAYKPEHPHAVCAIAYARSMAALDLTVVTDFGDWSSTASL